jgi:hypothetical protein
MAPTRRQEYELLRSQLDNEISSFTADWREIGDYIIPRRPRFALTDVNKGGRRNQKIIDSTATLALRTLRSGMMAGITSPSRPWFKLGKSDKTGPESAEVKRWCSAQSTKMSNVFLRSNLYNVLPIVYGDMGAFGVGAMFCEEDFDSVIRFYSLPIGSYRIACDELGRVRVFSREFNMTTRQLVSKFGNIPGTSKINWDNISSVVKNSWDNGEYERWFTVCHIIQPNKNYDPRKITAEYKRYESVYYEQGTVSGNDSNYLRGDDKEKYLRIAGYNYFPVLAPRWEICGEDVYAASCPGIDAIGDVKGLQNLQKRKAQAIDKLVNPPMVGPSALKAGRPSILPGDITYMDVREGMQGFKPVHEVKPEINNLLLDIQDHQQRIRRAFYEDLFLMLSTSDRRQITAREIEERHEEKLLALGPVLEQLNQDLLDPLIDITFDFMMQQGLIEDAPDELIGEGKINVEYISVMALAQKLVGISGIERFAGFCANIAAQTGQPNSIRKVNIDKMIDVYGESLSINPEIIRSDDEVAEIINAEQKQAQAAQASQAMIDMSKSAKDLSQTDLEKDSALKRLLQQSQAGQLVPA